MLYVGSQRNKLFKNLKKVFSFKLGLLIGSYVVCFLLPDGICSLKALYQGSSTDQLLQKEMAFYQMQGLRIDLCLSLWSVSYLNYLRSSFQNQTNPICWA